MRPFLIGVKAASRGALKGYSAVLVVLSRNPRSLSVVLSDPMEEPIPVQMAFLFSEAYDNHAVLG